MKILSNLRKNSATAADNNEKEAHKSKHSFKDTLFRSFICGCKDSSRELNKKEKKSTSFFDCKKSTRNKKDELYTSMKKREDNYQNKFYGGLDRQKNYSCQNSIGYGGGGRAWESLSMGWLQLLIFDSRKSV